MFSKFFINKPVLSTIIAIIIVILGFGAIKSLPISQFPNLTPPTVVVSAAYPGADAETIANNILTPLEGQISGADGLMYMTGKASALSGTASITCTFNIGVNQDLAAVDIQNRINSVLSQLPQTTRELGVTVEKRTSDILLIVSLTSPDGSMSDTEISNYILTNMLDEIKKIPGAGRSQIFGRKDYAIRVWTDPDKMAKLGVTAADIGAAIKDQNIQVAPGRIGQAPAEKDQMWTMQLNSKGRLSTVGEFENVIIRSNPDGSAIRLKDVAKIELGSQSYEYFARVSGKPAAVIAIFADTNANALDTAEAVYKKMEELSKKFPPGIEYKIPYDTTDFIKISIYEVVKTLIEAIILVSLVIYLFLQSWRAALIPILSAPVSLTGAFIGMYLLGYSINTLTLFGLVLAIGIVVDDAIVVIENMERILQTEKLTPREVAIKAMSQVSGPVIAIVLVMCAVFIPATFIGGMTGQLYKQFAATIAISVVFSGFMAISFAPAIGALILKKHAEPARFFRWFNTKFELMTDNYLKRSAWMIRKSTLVFFIYLSTYGFIYFFHKTLPTAFVPMEDQGFFITSINLPDGATINRTLEVVKEVEKILANEPSVYMYTAVTGLNIMTFSQEPNSAAVFVRLKPWSERTTKELKLFGVIGSISQKYRAVKDANVIALPPPPIRGMGPSNMFSFKLLQMGDSNMSKLAATTGEFVKELKDEKSLKSSFTTMRASTPTLLVDVDREKAKSFGVSISDIFGTLQASIGYMNINQFDKNGKIYWVQVQSEAQYRSKPEDIGKAWVRSSSGKLLPLSNFISVRPSSAPSAIEHFNGSLSTTIMGTPANGYSSGDVIKRLEQIAAEKLPSNTSYDWEGLYLQEKLVGSKAFVIIVFVLILVYLILAALYEKWSLPISIMLAVPYGIAGAYAVVWVIPFLNNNVYFQIGLLTLIGLSAKNAILVVEFAEEQRQLGKSIYEATMEAARLRFRPMMMTSVAFLAGMLPLIMSSGAGAMSRFSIGVAMFGGMMAATFIERFFIPFLYYWVATARERFLIKYKRGADENY